MRQQVLTLLYLVTILGQHECVEVHFEAADSGFFLKHTRQPPVTPEIANIQTTTNTPLRARSNPYDSVLSVDRFTVVQTTQPVSIRASYGPFSTKQTVPARYIVPDPMDSQGDYMVNTTAALLELQQTNMHLDISAHLVSTSIPQDTPVLRVLFHAGADPGGHLQRQKICVLLHASMGMHVPLKGRCMPEGEDGVCVAEVVIPFSWWPALRAPQPEPRLNEHNSPTMPMIKLPQRYVQVSYSVFEPPPRNSEQCEPKVQIQPLTIFGQVPLVAARTPYKEIRADDTLTILMPQQTLYPMSKLHVPVFLHQAPDTEQKIIGLTMKARVKSGIRILSATGSSDSWNISIEKENPKHTTARVTVYRNEQDKDDSLSSSLETKKEDAADINTATEIFTWLLEIADDTKEPLDGKIVWSVSYVYDNSKMKDKSDEHIIDETRRRLIAKLEVNKDDIQAVLPMAKNWELMNTAVLTGRQVAQAMKVFIVSQSGKVADVTLQSSCHAEDESVIKVSSSCSSVYVDGSEIRGSSNASVIVKYGTYIGLAKFIVWMPEFPLEVYISDFRLSQVKGWKVIEEGHLLHKQLNRRRKKRSYIWAQHGQTGYYNAYNNNNQQNNHNNGNDKPVCKARYQQSPVEVYARFLAIDQNSGRISYFISRRTGLRITDLVQPLLRVADPKIATLKGRILQGRSMGRTDIQVLSPITGRVIGAKEIRVGSDKVSLTKLIVRVVSGLQLTISPDNTIENGYIAETSVTHKLTAQYQEGLLDIDLEFSDGSRTPLRDISVEDYFLLVESLDTEVVAFAPMLASHHPRVIAVGEGNGNLLRVTLLLSEDCRSRRNILGASKQIKTNTPLVSALAAVEVDFNNAENTGGGIVHNNGAQISNSRHEIVQNDGIIGRDRKSFHNNNGDLADIIVGIPMRDATHHYEPTVQARQHRGSIHVSSIDRLRYGKNGGGNHNMSSMEVGMYVLLTAFCFAIVVFVISCVVYASKFRTISIETGLDPLDSAKNNAASILLREPRINKESTTNAHDWVWLGRSTMDRSSITGDPATEHVAGNMRDSRIRITNNPILNYAQYNNHIQPSNVTSFDRNRNPIRLTDDDINLSQSERPRNVATVNQVMAETEYRPPVPPHRHMTGNSLINPMANAHLNEIGQNYGQKLDYQKHRHNKSMDMGRQRFNDAQSAPVETAAMKQAIKKLYIPNKVENHHHHQQQQQQEQQQQLQHATFSTHNKPQIYYPQNVQAQQAALQQQQEIKSSPVQIYSPHEIITNEIKETDSRIQMHNAELLIENSKHQQKNAFQFDSLAPKRNMATQQAQDATATSNITKCTNDNNLSVEYADVKRRMKNNPSTTHMNANGFVNGANKCVAPNARRSRVKRATVVGNPMFSNTVDGDSGSGMDESLGLDELDMDYEQIMHYFDNLKESNA